MTVGGHLTEFAGLPVFDFGPETGPDLPPDAAAVAWRIRAGFDEPWWEEVFGRFLEHVGAERVTALIAGHWGDLDEPDAVYPVEALVQARDRFPDLRALFVGDVATEESEVSWLQHRDLTPVVGAFPLLERLEVRGSVGLRLEPVASTALRRLRFETGGLPRGVVQAVAASDLPNLEHLDLWLGVAEYGGDATVADLAPFLGGERFPALRHLGLENSPMQDEIAAAVAGAPVVARLESLSLALGVLSDRGAEALLSGQPLTHLRRLDVHHHVMTEEAVARLRAALPGVEVDAGAPQLEYAHVRNSWEEDPWAFVAVSE
ncbi:STM4015 family protein [Actinomadura macrotermitis]|uniref:CalU1 n=1 Tax=Actinomadura macrotermitis TaxID=2585200 RepID=A0A7K0C4B1_9ACTN|nr:hypothetical protein [Actinomadura macrotermitis]